ncbi:MAG: PilN domain-containing protein [Candidatus Zixiibacteriota bacterium]
MIEINLLPKDYLKGSRSFALGKGGLYGVAGAVAVVVMLITVTFYQIRQLSSLQSNIERASERAAMLQRDIKVVDALTDVKTKINRRMEAVERLDRHRTVWVRILEDVAADVPDFVWLAGFKEKRSEPPKSAEKKAGQDKGAASPQQAAAVPDSMPAFRPVEIEGYAYTLNALAAFMISMMRSDFFDGVELVKSEETKFQSQNDERAYNFVVAANVHYLSDKDLTNLVANADEESEFNEADFDEADEPVTSDAPATVAAPDGKRN